MFDLEKAIVDWKERLRSSDSISPDSLAELESHLRDIIEALNGGTLDARESFTVATMRMGDAAVLEREFCKENPASLTRKQLLWMVGGYIGGVAIAGVIQGVGSLSAAAISFQAYQGQSRGHLRSQPWESVGSASLG